RDDRAQRGRAIVEDLLAGDVDLILTQGHDKLEGIPVYRASIVAVLPQHHPLRRQRQVSVKDLAATALLVAPRGFFSRDELDVCFAAAQPYHVQFDIAAESASASALLALGAAGRGIP